MTLTDVTDPSNSSFVKELSTPLTWPLGSDAASLFGGHAAHPLEVQSTLLPPPQPSGLLAFICIRNLACLSGPISDLCPVTAFPHCQIHPNPKARDRERFCLLCN